MHERLVGLARVWAAIALYHPRANAIDLDAAVLHAIAGARAAGSDEAYRAVLADFLDELHDPFTRIVEGAPAEIEPPATELALHRIGDAVVIAARVLGRQAVRPAGAWRYEGRVAMLIDERTMSQSEHTCLWLAAATDVTFVGSRTAGANGDVTSFPLPGDMTVTFTGHDVRWPDGRQLQRFGIEPHIEVRPTIEGLRAGRDEVLEAARAALA